MFRGIAFGQEEDSSGFFKSSQMFKKQVFVHAGFGMGVGIRNLSQSLGDGTIFLNMNSTVRCGMMASRTIMLGPQLDWFSSSAHEDYNNKSSLSYNTLGVFARYYISTLMADVFLGAGRGYERATVNGAFFSSSLGGIRYGVGVGVANFWSKTMHIDLQLRYNGALGKRSHDAPAQGTQGLCVFAAINFGLKKKP